METSWALFFLNPVFCYPEPLYRHIDNLTPLWEIRWGIGEVMLTPFALLDHMDHDHIRRLCLFQVMTLMAWLATGPLSTLLTQAFDWTHEPI